jgi:hypothetical protein
MRARLDISERVVSGQAKKWAEPPTFQADEWIPSLIINGENVDG